MLRKEFLAPAHKRMGAAGAQTRLWVFHLQKVMWFQTHSSAKNFLLSLLQVRMPGQPSDALIFFSLME